MYIQMFILKRAAFLLEGTQMTQFHHQKTLNKHSKAGILMKLTQNLVINASSLWTRN